MKVVDRSLDRAWRIAGGVVIGLLLGLVAAAAVDGCALWNAPPACSPWPQCGCSDPKTGTQCPDQPADQGGVVGPSQPLAVARDAGSDG